MNKRLLPSSGLCIVLMLSAILRSHAGGVVNALTEASLNSALSGGGTVIFSVSGTITVTTTKVISSDTVIDGSGQSVTISGGNTVRIFQVNSGVKFTIRNLTIANGKNGGANGSNGSDGVGLTAPTAGGNGGFGAAGGVLNAGGTITISGVTFVGNTAVGGNAGNGGNGASTTFNGASGGGGGYAYGSAIWNSNGIVTLTSSVFTNNTATAGSGGNGGNGGTGSSSNGGNGGAGGSAFGGAVYNSNGGALSVTDCTFANNSATGAIAGLGGNRNNLGSHGSNGAAGTGNGSGVHNDGGSVIAMLSTINNNAATGATGGAGKNGTGYEENGSGGAGGGGANGGGVFNNGGTLVMTNCTIVANTVAGGAGGPGGNGATSGFGGNGGNGGSGGAGTGGGIYSTAYGITTLGNCTITDNSAQGGGGGAGGAKGGAAHNGNPGAAGASNGGGVARDTGGLMLKNTILAEYGATGGNGWGAITDNGNNLSDDASIALPASGSRTNVNPQVGTLNFNGGPTMTEAIQSTNSPAFDAGDDSAAPITDQRHYYRSGRSDIGAYEFNGSPTRLTVTAEGPTASEEGNVGSFVLWRDGDLSSSVVVNYAITGTASSGVDYVALPASVTIPAGYSHVQLLVFPLTDATPEPGETVVLTLNNPTNFVIGLPNTATVTITDKSLIDRTKRFYRGSGTDPTFWSYVVPMDQQKGIRFDEMNGNRTNFYPNMTNWNQTLYHYNITNTLSQAIVTNRIAYNNPIAAFGSRVGGTPLNVSQPYSFGVYAGCSYYTAGSPLLINAYYRSNYALAGQISVPMPNPADANAWNSYLTNGFQSVAQGFGLTTVLSDSPNLTWGEWAKGAVVLTHTASGTASNYVFAVLNSGSPAFEITGMCITTNGGAAYELLYTMEFDQRPPWRSIFLDQPQFAGTPVPSFYQGKSIAELSTNGMVVTNSVSLAPTACTNLDNSPELRRHPILDQFVTDMRNDPIALANYVLNEIELTDAIDYNDSGAISEESVNLGGVSRGALGAYLEKQGSPTEQCALLVYLLRQAGVPATYVFPPHNGLKLLDNRLSQLLKVQLHGAVSDKGNLFTTNTMIAVNYPWVAAYIGTNWVHIFPWLKDHSIIEGVDISDVMPTNYSNGYSWVRDYVYGTSNLMSLAVVGDATPRAIYPRWLTQTLAQTAPGVSVDDIGARIDNRRNFYPRWQDFPTPTWVTNTSIAVESLGSSSITNVNPALTNIFDTLSVQIYSVYNPARSIQTPDMRLVDLHDRTFYITQTNAGGGQIQLTLVLAPFNSTITNQATFSSPDPTWKARHTGTVTLDATDDPLNVHLHYQRHRALPSNFYAAPYQPFLWLSARRDVAVDRPLRKGDVAAICLDHGRVTRDMLNVHAAELWQMESSLKANPSLTNSISPDLYQGSLLYLCGMTYYEQTSEFRELNRNLHKVNNVSTFAMGLSKLSPRRDGSGGLYNGGVDPILPNVDMFFYEIADLDTETLHGDTGQNGEFSRRDYALVNIADLSAEEHQAINTFYQQTNAVSTVRLLQLAQARGQGIVVLNAANLAAQGETVYGGKKLKDHDPALWQQVTALMQQSGVSSYAVAYLTPGPVTNAVYKGMGALVLTDTQMTAIISPYSLNGATGENLPNGVVSQQNSINVSLNGDGNTVTFQTPTSSQPGPWSGQVALTDLPSTTTAMHNGAYAFDSFDTTWLNTVNVELGLTPAGNPNDSQSQAIQFTENSGNLGAVTDNGAQRGSTLADPVHAVTGEFYVNDTDLSLPGPMALQVCRNYSSQNLADNQFGFGWKMNYMPYLSLNTNGTVVYAAEMNGMVLAYEQTGTNANVWLPTLARNPQLDNNTVEGIGSTANLFRSRIDKSVNGTNTFYKLSSPDGSLRTFQVLTFNNGVASRTRPYLITWQDNRGNAYGFQYGTNSAQPDFSEVRRIQSSNGNYLGFYFDVYGHIIEAYTGDGRRTHYDYDSFGDLIKVTRPDESELNYEYEHLSQSITNGTNIVRAPYSTHALLKEIKPDGRVLVNQYDGQRRVTNQLSTVGQDLNPIRNATFTYSNNFALTNAFTNMISGYTLIVDVNGNTNRYDYTNGLITKITDPLNQTLIQDWFDASETNKSGYYPRSLESRTDKRGLQTQFKYDSNGNLTNTTVIGDLTGDGITNQTAVIATTYNTNSLPLQVTDPVGNSTKYIYDTNFVFLPQQVIQYAGASPVSTNLFSYYNVTNVFTNGGTIQTNVAFGLLNREIRAYGSADSATNDWTFDGRGFVTQQIKYTGTSDTNVVLNFFYNSRGELAERVDAANRTNRFAFDGLGRPIGRETYESGAQTPMDWSYSYYNDNGELVWSDGPRSDPEDYIWRDYDGAGRKTTEIHWRSEAKFDGTGVQAPAGDDLYATTFYQYDSFGNLTKITDPLGNYTVQNFDAIGRMTSQVFYGSNAVALATNRFVYEPGGQISMLTNALGGVTKKFYTTTGQLKRQESPDGSFMEWRFDLSGRAVTNKLVNGNVWQTAYDDLNRRVTRYFKNASSTLATNITEFDRRGNVVKTTDVEGNVSTNFFDGLDRIKIAAGPVIITSSGGPPDPGGGGSTTNQQVTTYIYDASGKVLTIQNAFGEKTVTTSDAIGRPTLIEIRNPASQDVRVTSNVYATNHHSVTVWQGTGTNAIATTTYTDNTGNPILTVNYPTNGIGEYVWQKYDRAGNRVAQQQLSSNGSGVTVWATNGWTFDGLNRVATETSKDGATTTFSLDALGDITSRAMPNSLTWSATYLNDGRVSMEKTAGGGLIERTNSYSYYSTGNQWAGLLQTATDGRGVTRTISYDNFLRPATNSTTGSLAEQQTTTTYQYDRRGLTTNIVQSFASTNTGPSTAVTRVFDACSHLVFDSDSIAGAVQQNWQQSWDNAGRRTDLSFGGSIIILSSLSYGYRADGLMTQVNNDSFTYGDNGLLLSRNNPFRTLSVNQRDGRGRLLQQSTTVNAQSVLAETLSWRNDGRLSSYTATRSDFTDTRNYGYSTLAQRLTQESYNVASGQKATNSYAFDLNTSGGLGVLTSNSISGQVSATWNAPSSGGLDGLRRVAQEQNTTVKRSATGKSLGAATVAATLDGKSVSVQYAGMDSDGRWRSALEMTPGSHTLRAWAVHPSGQYTAYATNTFTLSATNGPDTALDQFDSNGNVTQRVWKNSGGVTNRTQTLTWDAFDRLVKVTDRDAQTNGFNWSAVYDGLGRRLRTTYTMVVSNTPITSPSSAVSVVDSWYDPQVEFLEIGTVVNGVFWWKVHGPDASGTFGGMQGVGGLEEIWRESLFNSSGVVQDAFGNVLGSITTGAVSWNATRFSSYGPVPGYESPALSPNVALSVATGWRGRRVDETGLIYLGARMYDPVAGRFTSADPLGHAASQSLFDFCSGDPVNRFDPTGRSWQQTYANSGPREKIQFSETGGEPIEPPNPGGYTPPEPSLAEALGLGDSQKRLNDFVQQAVGPAADTFGTLATGRDSAGVPGSRAEAVGAIWFTTLDVASLVPLPGPGTAATLERVAFQDAILKAGTPEARAAFQEYLQLEFGFARGASVQTPGITVAGERFVRVGATPQSLKFSFDSPTGALPGTYAIPEATFNALGRDPKALKNFLDLPGSLPVYYRYLEPAPGTSIQRGIVPGGQFGGIGGVNEVIFNKGF